MQGRCNSIANTLELHLSCTNPLILSFTPKLHHINSALHPTGQSPYSPLVSMCKAMNCTWLIILQLIYTKGQKKCREGCHGILSCVGIIVALWCASAKWSWLLTLPICTCLKCLKLAAEVLCISFMCQCQKVTKAILQYTLQMKNPIKLLVAKKGLKICKNCRVENQLVKCKHIVVCSQW